MATIIRRGLGLCRLLPSVVLGCLLAATPASAYLRDFEVREGATRFNSLAPKRENISCPSPKRALGGGASVSPFFSNLGLTHAVPFFNTSLTAASETDGIQAGWRLRGSGHCATDTGEPPFVTGGVGYVKSVQIIRSQSGFNRGTARTRTAVCPPGKSVISGGGTILPAGNDFAFRSMRRVAGGDRWRVSAGSVDQTRASWRLQSYAICANLFSPSGMPDYAGALLNLQNTGPARSFAVQGRARYCPFPYQAIGGGARVMGPRGGPASSNVVLTASQPILGPGPRARGWLAIGRETDPTGSRWRVQVRVVCARLDFPGP